MYHYLFTFRSINLFYLVLLLFTVLATACTALPEHKKTGSVPDAAGRNFAVLVLPEASFEPAEHEFFVSGISGSANTKKIISVPDAIKQNIEANHESLEWFHPIKNLVKNEVGVFDSLILAIPRVHTEDGVSTLSTEALAFDIEEDTLLARNIYHARFPDARMSPPGSELEGFPGNPSQQMEMMRIGMEVIDHLLRP